MISTHVLATLAAMPHDTRLCFARHEPCPVSRILTRSYFSRIPILMLRSSRQVMLPIMCLYSARLFCRDFHARRLRGRSNFGAATVFATTRLPC